MTHLPFTILAYFLNSMAVTANKLLLVKTIPDPLIYIFYISLVSLLAILVLPLTHIPSLEVFILASVSTLLWTLGAYFMFKALKVGQVARVIPVIGTLTPLILLITASTTNAITSTQAGAVVILVVGLIFLTGADWRGDFKKKELLYEIVSALFFAISYLVLRQAYSLQDFLTVIVWSRLILFPVGAIILLNPVWRKKIFAPSGLALNLLSPMGFIFILGQVAGGISELLLTFSISLANPALVNSLQGTQYVFLLIFSFILGKKYPDIFKRQASNVLIIAQLIGIGLIGWGLYMLAFST